MKYKCRYRRNNKERYWEVKEIEFLSEFSRLLEEIFEKTKEDKLEIIVKLEKEALTGK